MKGFLRGTLFLASLAGAGTVFGQAQIFPVPLNVVSGINATDTVWVGSVTSASIIAPAIWNPLMGTIILGGGQAGYLNGVSANGEVYCGQLGPNSDGYYWQNGSPYLIPSPQGDGPTNQNNTISADGSTLLAAYKLGSGSDGYTYNVNTAAVTDLGSLGSIPPYTVPTCVSSDGSVVAGVSENSGGNNRAFLWTSATGITDLGTPLGFPAASPVSATCMSTDGSIVYGLFLDPGSGNYYGFRWSRSGGMVPILAGPIDGCSADGFIALGFDSNAAPFLINLNTGEIPFVPYLGQYVDLTNWHIQSVDAISPDGQWFGAYGTRSDGTTGAIGVQIPPFPAIANNDTYQAAYATTLNVAAPGLLANDVHTLGASTHIQTEPANASSFTLNTDGSFSYTPAVGFSGNDSFTYVDLTGSDSYSQPATVNIAVASHLAVLHPSNSVPAGSPGFSMTLTGAGFKSGETVLWNGSPLSTTFVSSTTLTASVSNALLANASANVVSVQDPWGTVSNTRPFNCTSAVPAITGVSPSTAQLFGPSYTITVYGSGFVANSTVKWSNKGLPTTFISSTELQATVGSQYLVHRDTGEVTVANPVPGGGYSNPWAVNVR
jgi:probable HAF family extracellular repeat protein